MKLTFQNILREIEIEVTKYTFMTTFIYFSGDTTGSSGEEGPLNRNEAPSEEEQVPTIQRLIRPRPPPSPVANRKAPSTFGLSLKLKKGRRARHRYT